MTQEDKDLLLKDLCARLPYRAKCKYYDCCEGDYNEGTICGFERQEYIQIDGTCIHIEEVKLYLFPLSSMTNEIWDKEFRGYNITEFTRDSFKWGCETLEFYDYNPDLSDMVGFINQLIKNHFDIYGLIPKGLAIDATGLNIY